MTISLVELLRFFGLTNLSDEQVNRRPSPKASCVRCGGKGTYRLIVDGTIGFNEYDCQDCKSLPPPEAAQGGERK